MVGSNLGQAAAVPDTFVAEDDVRFYREQGYWLSPPILDSAVLDAAVRGQDRFYAGDVDAPFPGRTRYDDYDWSPADGADRLRKNDYASLMVRELAELVRQPAIAAAAARLSGASGIRLWHDQLLFKPPDAPRSAGNVGWHVDRQYWGTCSSEEMLTAWVPLEDVDETLGTITFVAGSHRWEDAAGGLDFFDPDLTRQEERLAARYEVRKVPAVLGRGQVSFHHCKLVHGSGPNRAERPRRSVAIHLQPADNAFTRGDDDAYHRNDDLVRRSEGVPDYADPRICPTLWPPA